MKKKSLVKKIFDIVLSIIFGLAIVLVALGFIQKATGKDILPYKIMYIYTDSMEPTIHTDSYVLVKKTSFDKIETNDIITFVSTDPAILGKYNTHRYIRYDEINNDLITKGDNNKTEDYYHVSKDAIKYKYICNLNFITRLVRAFRTTTGLLVTIVIVIGAISIWFSINNKLSKEELMDKLVKEEVKRLEEEQKNK